MGCYAQLTIEINNARVKDMESVYKVEQFFKTIPFITETTWYNNDIPNGFYGVKFEIGKNGEIISIYLDDYKKMFTDDLLFACQLSQILADGKVRLVFHGDDGSIWGFDVTKEHFEKLYYLIVTESQLSIICDYFPKRLLPQINSGIFKSVKPQSL